MGKNENIYLECAAILVIAILAFILGVLLGILVALEYKENQGEFGKLIGIVEYEMANANVTGNCLNYSQHYNQSFRKYSELDVRWENRYVDICNNLTLCDAYHTFIVVGGYGGLAVVDQNQYATINIKKIKNGTR